MNPFQFAYRLQLNSLWNFFSAQKIVPYLSRLGVDALYLSPILTAKKGSTHCYDMTNPQEVNPELGGEEGFRSLVKEAHKYSMSIVVDVVANHMAASIENPWWRDVLENGPHSRYSSFFDIDWNSPHQELKEKILVPYLPLPFHQVLEQGGIKLNLREEGICIEAGFHRLPCNPELYGRIFQRSSLDPSVYEPLIEIFEQVAQTNSAEEREARAHAVTKGKGFLSKLVVEHSKEVLESLSEINSNQHLLEEFLDRQYFRLEYWQTGFQYTNYRRFFDINELVALRAEEDHVFLSCHKKLFTLLEAGLIDCIRVDHPDGLKDPKKYFRKLREGGCRYLIAEKILEHGEPLRTDWNIEGSVGYEYLNTLLGLFIQRKSVDALTHVYEEFTEQKIDPKRLLFINKREYAAKYMSAEIAAMAKKFCPQEISKEEFSVAVIDFFASFPVYRTYITPADRDKLDDHYIQVAFETFDVHAESISKKLRQFFEDVFLHRKAPQELLYRFQQLSPPIMAKGFEDTHLYQFNRLICLNEVGGFPHEFGSSKEEFHAFNEEGATLFPMRFTTSNTHDTKRSEDVRLRIAALTEFPAEWAQVASLLKRETESLKHGGFPDVNFEYFIFQTLVGIMPLQNKVDQSLPLRVKAYLIKAAREAKKYTNWVNHNENYESAISYYVQTLFKDFTTPFWQALFPLIKRCEESVQHARVSMLILRMGSPGVFELYQGTELPFYALVDPDNRRAVDFPRLEKCFEETKNLTQIPKEHDRKKLFYLTRFAAFRKEHPELFISGEYIPLESSNGIIAFLRNSASSSCIVVARRFFLSSEKEEDFFHLPPEFSEKKWRDLFSKQVHLLASPVRVQEILHENAATVLYSYEH